MVLLVNFDSSLETQQFNDLLKLAIDNAAYLKIDYFLHRRLTPEGHRLRPSLDILNKAIRLGHSKLYYKLMNYPYSMIPDVHCLITAAECNRTKVFIEMSRIFPSLIDEIPGFYEQLIFHAIQNANVQMVKFIINELRYPLNWGVLRYVRRHQSYSEQEENGRRIKQIELFLYQQIDQRGVDNDYTFPYLYEEPIRPIGPRKRLIQYFSLDA